MSSAAFSKIEEWQYEQRLKVARPISVSSLNLRPMFEGVHRQVWLKEVGLCAQSLFTMLDSLSIYMIIYDERDSSILMMSKIFMSSKKTKDYTICVC